MFTAPAARVSFPVYASDTVVSGVEAVRRYSFAPFDGSLGNCDYLGIVTDGELDAGRIGEITAPPGSRLVESEAFGLMGPCLALPDGTILDVHECVWYAGYDGPYREHRIGFRWAAECPGRRWRKDG